MFRDNREYLDNYRRRILWFMWITMGYLAVFLTYTAFDLFMKLNWPFEYLLYSYCAYAIWFNSYSFFRYAQNSREEEKKQDVVLYQAIGLTAFDHQDSRRKVFMWSAFAVLVNMALITFTYLGVL